MEIALISIVLLLGLGALFSGGDFDFGGGSDSNDRDDEDDDVRRVGTNGDDILDGGNGDDFLQGLRGDDVLSGGAGDDRIFANEGVDYVSGGSGDDEIFLGDGADTMNRNGDEGNDFIRAGQSDDIIRDAQGSNTVYADSGDDIVYTVDDTDDAGTIDTIFGGTGNDLLVGDNGDILHGRGGEDKFGVEYKVAHNQVAVIKDFNEAEDAEVIISATEFNNTDNLTFTETSFGGETGLMISLDGSQVAFLEGATASAESMVTFRVDGIDRYGSPVESDEELSLIGGIGDDMLIGESASDFFQGSFGNDVILGQGGDDRIFSNEGDDTVFGGSGDDRIFLSDGDDTSSGLQSFGNDFIRGGGGNDVITDWGGSNTIYGDSGNDIIDGTDKYDDTATPDTLIGGVGNDTLIGDKGDILSGRDGLDNFEVVFDVTDTAVTVIEDFEELTDGNVTISTTGYTTLPTISAPISTTFGGETGIMFQLNGVDAVFLANTATSSTLAARVIVT